MTTKVKTDVKKNVKTSKAKSSRVSKKSLKNMPKKKVVQKRNNVVEITTKRKINPKVTLALIFVFGVLTIFSTYAWFSMNLNVKIKTFNMVVAKNSDFSISFDGVNFEHSIEITKKEVYENLGAIYPNYLTQWPSNGLIPVSSPGITNSNSHLFDMYETNGVLYRPKDRENGFLKTEKSKEDKPREYNYYLAFDIFFKNETKSPIADNLFFETSTLLHSPEETDDEMIGLINSFRVGIVKVGSVPLDATTSEIQNITCKNDCKSIIYEPNSKMHGPLSRERARKYGVNLIDGERFPTYAYKKAGGPIYVKNSVSGSDNIDMEYFTLQNTITEDDFDEPLFTVPNGITKARVYVWIEGQDIDSLETLSKGTEVEINIDFVKDTAGFEAFDE